MGNSIMRLHDVCQMHVATFTCAMRVCEFPRHKIVNSRHLLENYSNLCCTVVWLRLDVDFKAEFFLELKIDYVTREAMNLESFYGDISGVS